MINSKTQLFFWRHVDFSAGLDACWPWVGGHDSHGYGTFELEGKTQGAHRASYLMEHGEIPNGMQVLHRCDNPACCNPGHLFLGTASDNMKDASKKGRLKIPVNDNSGEKNGRAKLTYSNVSDIRKKLGGGYSLSALSSEYGVSPKTISQIRDGETWVSTP